MHVGRLEDRSFTQHDVELLQVAGERVAAAVQTRRAAVESAAGAMLERELLPSRLPTLPGLQLAARYAPAEDRSVGGDWYDAFVLPSGAAVALIGDIAGHGLGSAVMVGRVRSAIRSYALLGDDVSDVFARVNRKLLPFENATMVTVLWAVAEPPFDRFTLTSAGHLPPVLATPTGTDLVSVLPGPPLGAVAEAQYRSVEVALPASSTLLLYTDGLIERRGEALDSGLARLRSVVVNGSPEAVCREVMLRLVGSTSTVDDVALLALGRGDLPPPRPAQDGLIGELRLPAEPQAVAQARTFALHTVGDIPPSPRGVVELLVSELATNCVVHAASEFSVRVFRSIGSDRLRVECSDAGAGNVAPFDADPSDTHGRGLLFVRHFSDDWGVRTNEPAPGKTVWFLLDVDGQAAPPAAPPAGKKSAPLVLDLSGQIDMARAEEIVAGGGALLADAIAAVRAVTLALARALLR